MLTAFYIICAVLTAFVVLSLAIVRAHEKKAAERAEAAAASGREPLPEEEFFSSPIYKVMEVVAHL